jgi:hypothetical protein
VENAEAADYLDRLGDDCLLSAIMVLDAEQRRNIPKLLADRTSG